MIAAERAGRRAFSGIPLAVARLFTDGHMARAPAAALPVLLTPSEVQIVSPWLVEKDGVTRGIRRPRPALGICALADVVAENCRCGIVRSSGIGYEDVRRLRGHVHDRKISKDRV